MPGRDPSEQHGFVNTPIYRGSTVLYPTTDDLLHRRGRYVYGTAGTPTTEALERAWTELTGRRRHGADAVRPRRRLARAPVVPEERRPPPRDGFGLPADPRLLRHRAAALRGGDDLLRSRSSGPASPALMRPNTAAVFTEAPGSQSFEMQDVPAIAEVAHARGAVVAHGQHLGDAARSSRRTSAASTSPSRPAPNT